MATYVPGVETYLPDIKPFTPDYKFLSAVLDVRTDKYNTNWKATNDLYNKVVYADLSRTDTKDQRDQYINQIAPSLEKISGMDLSMVQNADSAKAVFAPFFEDDLIVSDIMHTNNYKKEIDFANRLMSSPDREQRSRYNEDGIRSLQYQMEDFIIAAPDKAMRMGLPKFIEGADLMETAQKLLGEMKPPLKIKKESPQGDWIITQQNGTLVIPAATAYLEKALLSDPKITRFYQNQAFVRSRDRAAEGLANGEFSSVEQGQSAWAQETILKIAGQNAYYLEKEKTALAEREAANDRWKNYQESNGIVPGSDDEKAMIEQRSAYERTKAALEARENIQSISNEPTKDFRTTLNKAYNLYSQAYLSRDIQQAAAVFASRDSEITIRENEFVKQRKQFQYDLAKIEVQAQNAKELVKLKGKIDYDLAEAEGKIIPKSPVLDVEDDIAVIGDLTTTEFAVDENGLPNANINVVKESVIEFTKVRTGSRGEQLDIATKILTFLNPAGQVNNEGKTTQKYTVKVGGENFTGTIDQIKNKLGTIEGGVYKYKNDIGSLYDQQSAILNDPKQMARYPGKAKSQTYLNLFQQIYSDQGLNAKIETQEKIMIAVSKIYKKTHDQAIPTIRKESPKTDEYMKNGMPGIYTNSKIIPMEMNEKQYVQYVKDLAAQGKIKNIDRVNMRKEEYMNYVDSKVMVNGRERIQSNIVYSDKPLKNARRSQKIESVMYTDKTGRLVRAQDRNQLDQQTVRPATVLSERDIEKKAKYVYNEIKTFTNSALTLHKGTEYQTATYRGLINGKKSGPDMFTAPLYKAPIDPLSPTLAGQTMLAQMMTQKNMLDQKGIAYNIVLGDLKDKKDKASIVDDELARRAYNAYVTDMKTWLGNPKRSNSADIAPRGAIEYSSTLGAPGEGNKTTAGYMLNGFNQWLSSKVKGKEADDGTGGYGLFSSDEVIKLKNGISMVFDKSQDVNPRSENKKYYSKTLSAIEASDDNFVEYTYPGINGMTPTASYRIVKNGNDQYYATYKINTYQPNGRYRSSDWEQIPLNVGSFNTSQEIDAQIKNMEQMFQLQRNLNLEEDNKNSAIKGRKN